MHSSALSSAVAAAAAAMLLLAPHGVAAHGFLVHPGPRSVALQNPTVRNYAAISTNIDSLRNPIDKSTPVCRGAPKSRQVTSITLENGKPFTVTMAFSIGAAHIGPCGIEILDANLGNPVQIASVPGPNGCAVRPFADVSTDKGSPATSQCPGKVPKDLVTNDMCLTEWTFNVRNADKIKCTDCVMRWTWSGQHISVDNPEDYENCADVRVNVAGGSGGSSPAPSPLPKVEQKTTTERKPKVSPSPSPKPSPKPDDNKDKDEPGVPKIEVPIEDPSDDNNGDDDKNLPDSDVDDVPKGPVAGTPNAPIEPNGKSSTSEVADGYNACQKSTASTGRSMACSSDAKGFFVCFPGEIGRDPILMSCAAGTKCQKAGDFINCVDARF